MTLLNDLLVLLWLGVMVASLKHAHNTIMNGQDSWGDVLIAFLDLAIFVFGTYQLYLLTYG